MGQSDCPSQRAFAIEQGNAHREGDLGVFHMILKQLADIECNVQHGFDRIQDQPFIAADIKHFCGAVLLVLIQNRSGKFD